MCGIAGTFNLNADVEAGTYALRHRGPDAQNVISEGRLILGHVRLSIIDPKSRSDQPFRYGDVLLAYNGEIWNYSEIKNRLIKLGKKFKTTGDTEVVAAALNEWGDNAFNYFRGMFTMVWSADDGKTINIARDPFGEIPIHIIFINGGIAFASEIKALTAMGIPPFAAEFVQPGTIITASQNGIMRKVYYEIPVQESVDGPREAAIHLKELMQSAVKERRISDVPICALISGGIDSSTILHFLSNVRPDIVVYTAIYDEKSSDLKRAREMAEAAEVELREVKVRPPTADELAEVVRIIEMPHKAQVEIGWPCLKLAEVMRGDGFKVTFSGEGSDELWASYGFAYHALKTQNWRLYRKNLFMQQHRKNFARCNKIFMSRSVECRLPFLHVPLVEYAISLSREAVECPKQKGVLREAMRGLLPDSIIERQKVAFQDGMGIKKAISRAVRDPRRFYGSEFRKSIAD